MVQAVLHITTCLTVVTFDGALNIILNFITEFLDPPFERKVYTFVICCECYSSEVLCVGYRHFHTQNIFFYIKIAS